MLNYMPFKPSKVDAIKDLKSFFGFCRVKVVLPKGVERPLLPVRSVHKGKTIFPTGQWIGTYFSEELKACACLSKKVSVRKRVVVVR